MLDIETIKQNVSTKPFFNGGASFKTHYLAKTRDGYAFKTSLGAILFTLLFIVVGFSILVFGFYSLTTYGKLKSLIHIIVGSVFLVGGCYLLFFF